MLKNIFIRTYDKEWEAPSNVLKEKLNFQIVDLNGKIYGNFPTKKELLIKEAENILHLLRHLSSYNHSNIIICPNYCALSLLALKKLGILKCNKIFWYGVYIHNPQMFKIVRFFLRLLGGKGNSFKVVVFSKPEINMYSKEFGLSEKQFIYVPYGEWNEHKQFMQPSDKGYYFAGGYANRDFIKIAKLFQNRPWEIIIAASKSNTDFVDYTKSTKLSDNIKVLWDIPLDEFNTYLRECRALVMIMKYNTGASGQIVLLHSLENHKLIIASYTDVIDEYVQNDKTGVVLKEITQQKFDELLQHIENPQSAEHYQRIAENGHQHFLNTFSFPAISAYLVQEIKKEM